MDGPAVVQSLSRVLVFVALWTTVRQVSLSFTVSWSLLRFLVHDAIQPSHPLSPSFPPALNLSQHQDLFQWVSPLYQVAKVFEFKLQHQSFQWTLISFRIDSFDLIVQGILKSLPQHHNLRMSVLQCSAFSVVQLSHLCAYSLSHFWLFETLLGCSPPGSSVYGILQARILEWVSFSTHIPMWL